MKYQFTLLMMLILVTGKLSAQTRYYSFGYSNLPFELAGASDLVLKGDYGFTLSTHKFRTTKVMRGFTFSYHQLGASSEYEVYNYDYMTGNTQYIDVKSDVTVKKYTLGYESIRFWGNKEIDDRGGALYGTIGYYLHYNMVTQEYQSEVPGYTPEESDGYTEKVYFTPVDLSLNFGIGYQYRLSRQLMLYGEGKLYVSVTGNAGYEYGVGIRYKGLGAKR